MTLVRTPIGDLRVGGTPRSEAPPVGGAPPSLEPLRSKKPADRHLVPAIDRASTERVLCYPFVTPREAKDEAKEHAT